MADITDEQAKAFAALFKIPHDEILKAIDWPKVEAEMRRLEPTRRAMHNLLGLE